MTWSYRYSILHLFERWISTVVTNFRLCLRTWKKTEEGIVGVVVRRINNNLIREFFFFWQFRIRMGIVVSLEVEGGGQHLSKSWTDILERRPYLENLLWPHVLFQRGISYNAILGYGWFFCNAKSLGVSRHVNWFFRNAKSLGSRQSCIRRKQQQCSKSGKRLEHHLIDLIF